MKLSSAVEEVVEIFMRRDDMTREEALDTVAEIQSSFEDCDFDMTECEDIMQDYCLELDYIFAFV